jgi:quercetin dioxygenase-like cupin family protein
MQHVGTLSDVPAEAGAYAGHSSGYTRTTLVDRGVGSVHQEVAVAELEPGGRVEPHAHAFEEALYVLAGELRLSVAGGEEELPANSYAWIEKGVPHALASESGARWLEVSAPIPGAARIADTVFTAGTGAVDGVDSPYRIGSFDGQLPEPSSTPGLPGFGAANVGGASLKMLVDRELGASQFNLMLIQYVPGGLIREHDHAFEEAFFFLEGEIEALVDGERRTLRAGDFLFTPVGGMHALENTSDAPVRWLETQVPQPPSRHQARFVADWERTAQAARDAT